MKTPLVLMASALAMLGCTTDSVSTAGRAALPRARKPKALLIMLDGARADALAAARMPAVQSLRDGSWAQGYRGAWTLFGQNTPDARPSSAANHTAIFTAVNAEKSRVFQNGQTKNGDYAKWPTWLKRVTDAVPGTKGLFIFSWGEGKQYPSSQNVRFVHDTDANNGKNIGKMLAAPDAPDAIQYFIDLPDHGGHSAGFYPFSREYLHALYTSDTYIAAALDGIRRRPTFEDEDWLVMVTADHGGYARSHGMWGGQASTIPLVLSGRDTPSGRLPGAPRHYDLTATALAHFGLDPAALKLDGHPLVAATPKAAPRALKDGLAAHLFSGWKKLGVRKVKGSEKLAFENGGDFAMTLWARLPASQTGDPVIFSNKDWNSGMNPGIALVASKATDGVKVPGVCLNAGRPNKGRIDMGTFDIEPGQWTFYAVVRNSEGVLTVYQGRADGHLNWICARAPDVVVKSGLPFRIGQDGTGAYRHSLSGDVDDFALWTRALSHEDVQKIFEAGRQGVPLGELL